MKDEKVEKIKEILEENKAYKKEYERKKKKQEEELSPKNNWALVCGILLFLLCIFIEGFLCYKCFILKEFGKKVLVANSVLSIPLFFFTLVFFTKGKVKKWTTVLGYSSLVFSILFTLAWKFDYIKLPMNRGLPDFTGRTLTEVIEYTSSHQITLEQIFEYSDTVEEYHIISQSIKDGTPLKEVKNLDVVVSWGPNYEKESILPSFVGQNIDDALDYMKENYFQNITVDYFFSEIYEKDTIISQNISGSLKRSAEITLEVSLGTEEDLVPVSMEELKGMSLFDATLFLKRNGISYELQYEFSDSVKRNCILSQSEKKGVMIDPKISKVTLVVSKGRQIKVPNLLSMTMDEVISWITENHLKIEFSDRYDGSKALGTVIEANYNEGDVVEEGTVIKIVTSKGQLLMKTFDNINDFRAWANRYGITYSEEYEFSTTVESGKIIRYNVQDGDVLNLTDTVVVTISSGSSLTIPNFVGSTKTAIQKQCKQLGLSCTFYYQNNAKAKDIAIYQNKKAGSVVAEGTSVRITLSNGVTPSNSGNGSSSGNSNPTPVPSPTPSTPACTSTQTHTLIIQTSWVTGGSASATINTLRTQFASKYPNVTFIFQTKAGNNPSGYIHEDSPITNRSQIQDCKTYTIIVTE